MRPASDFIYIQLSNSRVFLIIQLSNSRAFAREKFGPEEIYPLFFSGQLHFWEKKIIIKIPSLTVENQKNRCIPCISWSAAIFAVVTKYSILFPSFAFFLNSSHFAFG